MTPRARKEVTSAVEHVTAADLMSITTRISKQRLATGTDVIPGLMRSGHHSYAQRVARGPLAVRI